ncbi:MAG: formate acetyltransferase, partial [Clostridia bacterium]|nr:formate acetyltransferase [Clostridia bacterium]
MEHQAYRSFTSGNWQNTIDVRDFVQKNYTPYEGDDKFLVASTKKTKILWSRCVELLQKELDHKGILDIDTETVSGILSFKPGYIDEENEVVFGLQTDAPLKRMVNPFGGIRLAKKACEAYGYKLSHDITEVFTTSRKTHNDGVFQAYTQEMKKARHCGVITGLPDAYGRGRIIGDYRRVALYGINRLIYEKQSDFDNLLEREMSDETIRLREEVSEQIQALKDLAALGDSYGFDLRKPASTAFEAVQWTYLAFLGAIKETNGAANSLGRINTFLDIYIERDMEEGLLTEETAQELIDQLVIKLRLIRHLRTPDYNELFAGDPVWITESLAGMAED